MAAPILWAPGKKCVLSAGTSHVHKIPRFRGGGLLGFFLGGGELSGPLRLRVQSRSRTRLRIAASIAFLFRACFKGVLDTIAPLSRG